MLNRFEEMHSQESPIKTSANQSQRGSILERKGGLQQIPIIEIEAAPDEQITNPNLNEQNNLHNEILRNQLVVPQGQHQINQTSQERTMSTDPDFNNTGPNRSSSTSVPKKKKGRAIKIRIEGLDAKDHSTPVINPQIPSPTQILQAQTQSIYDNKEIEFKAFPLKIESQTNNTINNLQRSQNLQQNVQQQEKYNVFKISQQQKQLNSEQSHGFFSFNVQSNQMNQNQKERISMKEEEKLIQNQQVEQGGEPQQSTMRVNTNEEEDKNPFQFSSVLYQQDTFNINYEKNQQNQLGKDIKQEIQKENTEQQQNIKLRKQSSFFYRASNNNYPIFSSQDYKKNPFDNIDDMLLDNKLTENRNTKFPSDKNETASDIKHTTSGPGIQNNSLKNHGSIKNGVDLLSQLVQPTNPILLDQDSFKIRKNKNRTQFMLPNLEGISNGSFSKQNSKNPQNQNQTQTSPKSGILKQIQFQGKNQQQQYKQQSRNIRLIKTKSQSSDQQDQNLNFSKSAPTSGIQMINQQQQSHQIEDGFERSNTAYPTTTTHMQGAPINNNLARFSTMGFTNFATQFQNSLTDNFSCLGGFNQQSYQQYQEKGVVEIIVQDSGIGISDDGLKKLFKPYSQVDKTINSKYGGTGLGLCICSELIQCMNGKIEVKSEIGKGTKFIVSIPLEVSADISSYIDENELDVVIKDQDLLSYEFLVLNRDRSFGINQIKQIFLKKTCNVYFKEPRELLQQDKNKLCSFFKHEKTYKAFIVDFQTIRQQNSNLLQILSNQQDTMKIDNQAQNTSNTSVNLTPQNQNQGSDSGQQSQISIEVKIPVIILITQLLDETKIKRAENIFVQKVPFEVKSMKKILYFLKRYYMNQLNQYRIKNQQGVESKIGSKEELVPNDGSSSKAELQNQQSSRSNQQSQQDDKFSSSQNLNGLTMPKETPHLQAAQQLFIRQGSNRSTANGFDVQGVNSNPIYSLYSNSKKSLNIKSQSLLNQIRETDQDMEQMNTTQHQNSQGVRINFTNTNLPTQGNQSNSSTNNQNQHTLAEYSNIAKGDLSPDFFPQRFYNLNSQRSNVSWRLKMNSMKRMTDNFLQTSTGEEQYAMVVNDEQFTLKITSMLLNICRQECSKKFNIITATDGKEAVEKYKSIPNIKLILMDIEMKSMDGYEATKLIREFEEEQKCTEGQGCKISFIVGASGNQSQQHFRQCQKVGMNEVIVIPISNKKIIEWVNNLF